MLFLSSLSVAIAYPLKANTAKYTVLPFLTQQESLQARTEAIRQSSKQTTTTEEITVETKTPAAQTPSGIGGEAPPPAEPVPAMW